MNLISKDDLFLNNSVKLLTKFLKNIDNPNKAPINIDLVHKINKKYMALSNTNITGGSYYSRAPADIKRQLHELLENIKKLLQSRIDDALHKSIDPKIHQLEEKHNKIINNYTSVIESYKTQPPAQEINILELSVSTRESPLDIYKYMYLIEYLKQSLNDTPGQLKYDGTLSSLDRYNSSIEANQFKLLKLIIENINKFYTMHITMYANKDSIHMYMYELYKIFIKLIHLNYQVLILPVSISDSMKSILKYTIKNLKKIKKIIRNKGRLENEEEDKDDKQKNEEEDEDEEEEEYEDEDEDEDEEEEKKVAVAVTVSAETVEVEETDANKVEVVEEKEEEEEEHTNLKQHTNNQDFIRWRKSILRDEYKYKYLTFNNKYKIKTMLYICSKDTLEPSIFTNSLKSIIKLYKYINEIISFYKDKKDCAQLESDKTGFNVCFLYLFNKIKEEIQKITYNFPTITSFLQYLLNLQQQQNDFYDCAIIECKKLQKGQSADKQVIVIIDNISNSNKAVQDRFNTSIDNLLNFFNSLIVCSI